MADTKITQLTAASAVTDDDLFVGVDSPASGAATKKWTAATVKTYARTSLPTPSASSDAATKSYVDSTATANAAAARLYLAANYR